MHKLLARQLANAVPPGAVPNAEEWKRFIETVNAAYEEADADRGLMEHSLELTSDELLSRSATLRSDNEKLTALREQLQRERDHAELLIDSAGILAIVVTPGHGLTLLNRTARDLTGYDVEELRGDRWLTRCIRPEDQPRFERALAQGPDALGAPLEIPFRTSGGAWLLIRWHVRPLRPGNPDEGLVLVGTDETTRARLEAETATLRERRIRDERINALGTLVAGVAHEINNPLTYIKAGIELAQLDLADATETLAKDSGSAKIDLTPAREQLQTALEGTDRIAHITRALRVVARQNTAVHNKLDLNHVALDVANLTRGGFPLGVELELRVATSPVEVVGNAAELHQVALNLVKNAQEAMTDHRGTITVSTFEDAKGCALRVHDNGPGMAKDVASQLFTPFFTTKPTGTGLGLSIVNSIVQQHAGTVDIDTSEGTGTSVTVRFPG